MSRHAWLTWIDGRGRHRRQAASADRLRARIEGSGGGGQAEIAMSRQGRGLRGRTDGYRQSSLLQSGVTACNNKVQKLTSTGGRSENGSLSVRADDIVEITRGSCENLTTRQTGRWYSTRQRVTTSAAAGCCHRTVSATTPAPLTLTTSSFIIIIIIIIIKAWYSGSLYLSLKPKSKTLV